MTPPRLRSFAPLLFLISTASLTMYAADPVPVAEVVTVVDGDDKELKLAGVKYTLGVRRLGWLGEVSATTEDGKKGPWAFELREPNSTTFQKGVITLVPLPSIESVKYDYTKMTATVAVKDLKEPVVGTTEYRGFSFLGLEGDVGGVKAKLTGGEIPKLKKGPKTGFKSATFPAAKPLPARNANAPVWAIRLENAKPDDPPHTVRNLKALYQLAGGIEQLAESLPVRKGDPVSFGTTEKPATIKKFEVVAVDPNKKTVVLDLDSGDRTAVVPTGELDKKPATLLGLVGEVDAGWKLFPLHTIREAVPGK